MKPVLAKVFLAAAFCAATAAPLAPGQTSTPEIMRQKLVQAQKLLRALVFADFDAIEEHATEIDRLAELQSWYVLPTPEYADHSREFRQAAQAVAEAGKSRRLEESVASDSSAIGTCVDCHEYMRRVHSRDERLALP